MQQNSTQFTRPGVDSVFQYITFWIDEHLYGIQATEDWEVISGKTISPVQGLPEFVSGVIIWKARVIPVLDIRICLQPEESATSNPGNILIMRSFKTGNLLEVGISIDNINIEIGINPEVILEHPDILNEGFIGTTHVGSIQVTLLDIKELLLNKWPAE